MLNLLMTEETPDSSENRFEAQSFSELMHMVGRYARIICVTGKREGVLSSWDNFTKSWEEENAGDNTGNIRQKWNRNKSKINEMSLLPGNHVQLNELVVLEPAIMFRKVMKLLYQPKSVRDLAALVDELRPYSMNADRITLYDRYLLQFGLDMFEEGETGHCGQTLRKLVVLFRGLVCDETGAPEEIHVITNLVNSYHVKTNSAKYSFMSGFNGLDWLDSPDYKSRSYQILIETIAELRKVYPALNSTHFTVVDCSSITKGGLAHDRFVTFNKNPLISSAGFCFNLKRTDFEGSDLGAEKASPIPIDPTIIFPVNVPLKVPSGGRSILIART